jgi:hypothetical protein
MGIGLFGNTKVKPIQRRVLDKAFYALKRIIKFKAREFRERPSIGKVIIFLRNIEFFCVKSVHKILNENRKLFGQFPQEPYIWCMWSLTRQPEEAPDFKWRNTCPGYLYIQGLKQNE